VATQFGANYYVYHFDGTGHTVALTDKNNLVTHKYAYAPYGKVLGQVEPAGLSQPFKYAGQVGIFTETDNIYCMRARYYDAETGRFISEEPAGFIDGPNLYAYVGGNPVRYLDPSGRAAIGLAGGIDVNFNLFGIPIDATGSVSVVMDDSGDLQVYGTPEAGFTTSQKPDTNGFLRAIVAPAQNVKVSSFGGVAPSFSGTLGRVSGSVTFTGDGNIYELGVAYPGGGLSGSVTVGIGVPLTSALHHGGGGTFGETYRQAVNCP
jgi:RHS repeat-associated protein